MFAHHGAGHPRRGYVLALVVAAAALQGCQSPLGNRAAEARVDNAAPGSAPAGHTRSGSGAATPAVSPRLSDDRQAIELGDDAELVDYLAYAAANSGALRAAYYRWRAAVERGPQVTALPDPMLGYGYFLEAFTARRGMEQHMFELSQTFPWFGKLRLRGDAASAAAEAAAHEYEEVRLGLFLDVQRAYYELYQLRRETELTEENLELLRQFEAIVRAQFRVGQATHADVVRSQVQLGRLEDRLRQLNDLRRPAVARLNAVLNRAPEAPIAWPREVPRQRLDVESDVLLASLERDNPQLRALERQIEQGRIETRLAGRDFYPDVTVGAMGALRGDEPLLARISINVPIWRDKYRAAVREANARRIATAYMRKDRSSSLGAELHEALFDHDDAQRRIELYNATLIPKARESLEASLTAFQAGTIPFLELLDAERTLLEFQLSESRARTDRAIALARLDALVGSAVPRVVEEHEEPADVEAPLRLDIEREQPMEPLP